MKKVWLHHTENSAVGYYRIWQPAKYLPPFGWDVHRLKDELPAKTFKQWEKDGQGTDLFVCQRADNPEVMALFLALRELYEAPVIYEIDDNIFDVSPNSPSYEYFYPGSPYIEVATTFMQQADAITVTTEPLKEAYAHLNKHIYILPNQQDPSWWRGVKREPNDQIVLGWAGGHTHYDDLKLIKRPLKRVLSRHKDVIFRWTGFRPDFFKQELTTKHKQFDFIDGWAHVSRYPRFLAKMNIDVGLAPITDRPFNWGKSNIKWQEYAMLETPTIASNIGPYQNIKHGETGFLATTEDDWAFQIERLIKDAKLRQTIGAAAKREVLAEFNIKTNIGLWNAAYNDVIDRFKSELRANGSAYLRAKLPQPNDNNSS